MAEITDRMPARGPTDSPLVVFGRSWPTVASKRMLTGFSWSGSGLVHLAFIGVIVGLAATKLLNILYMFLALSAAFFAVWWLSRSGRWGNTQEWEGLAETPPRSARVACVGSVPSLKDFARHGPIRDEFFEVFSCVSPFALRTSIPSGLTGFGISVAILVLCTWILGMDRAMVGWFAGMFIGSAATAMLWPTVLRVSPGRLEVLERSMLNARTLARTEFDLRQSAVLVDLNQKVVFIARDGRTVEVWIKGGSDPDAVAAAILRAAVSTHAAPALPDDAIIG